MIFMCVLKLELEVGQYKYVRWQGTSVQISGSARLYLAGLAKPHTFLWCNTYLKVVQLSFELELRRTRYKNEKNGYKIRHMESRVNVNGI